MPHRENPGSTSLTKTRLRRLLQLTGIAIVLIAYLGPSSYRKYQMDKEVDRLCAIDGGANVFERVALPSAQFNRWDEPNIPVAGTDGEAKSSHYLVVRSDYLVKNDECIEGHPSLSRFSAKVIRRSDGATLGEVVSYSRMGGDPYGPWHPSHYNGCSAGGDKALKKEVFVKLLEKVSGSRILMCDEVQCLFWKINGVRVWPRLV